MAPGDAATVIGTAQRREWLAARQAAGPPSGAAGMAPAAGLGGALAVGGGAAAAAGVVFGRMGEPPTAELLARIEALPPVVDEPTTDLDDAARPAPGFSFRQALRPQRARIALAAVLVGGNALAALAGPYLVGLGVERGVQAGDGGWLAAAAGLFLASVLVVSVLFYLSTLVSSRIGQELLLGLRVRVFAHLQRLSLDYYDGEMTGRILTRMTSDIEALQSLLQSGFLDALVQLVTFVGAVAVLASMNGELALVVLAVVPALVAATVVFRRRSARAYGEVRERIAAVNANLAESISGVRVAQAFVREQPQHGGVPLGRRRAPQRPHRLDAHRLDLLPVRRAAVDRRHRARAVGGCRAGPRRRARRRCALRVRALPHRRVRPDPAALAGVRHLPAGPGGDGPHRRPAGHAGDRGAGRPPVAGGPVARRGGVRGRVLRLRRRGGAGAADVSLAVDAGETVAFVGQTGAGKSTLVKLAARLYDPTGGRILVDGTPLTDLDLDGFRRRLGFVPQEAFLFTGTVRDNIAYARPEATDAEVEAAARAVGAHDFVAGLPAGYLQPVVERGRSLSAGQRQLIALARAELVDPAILILDEATANLDLATEARVVRAMGRLSRGPHHPVDRAPPPVRGAGPTGWWSSTTGASSRSARPGSCSPPAASTPALWASHRGEAPEISATPGCQLTSAAAQGVQPSGDSSAGHGVGDARERGENMSHVFLSDDWFDAVEGLRDEAPEPPAARRT